MERIAFVVNGLSTNPEPDCGKASAEAVFAMLVDPSLGACESKLSRIVHGKDYTDAKSLLKCLDAVLEEATAPYTLVFYYIGHGTVEENGPFLLGLGDRAWPFVRFVDAFVDLNKPATNRALFILDACHSGAALADVAHDQPVAVLVSSAKDAATWSDHSGNPVFTHWVLECIKSGAGNRPTLGGRILVTDILRYLSNNIPKDLLDPKVAGAVVEPESADFWVSTNTSGNIESWFESSRQGGDAKPEGLPLPSFIWNEPSIDVELLDRAATAFPVDMSDPNDRQSRAQQMGLFAPHAGGQAFFMRTPSMLCFAKAPQAWLPWAVSDFVRPPPDPNQTRDPITVGGPLLRQLDKLVALVMEALAKDNESIGIERPERPDLPEELVREILSNALIHRNYCDKRHVLVEVAGTELVVTSPGPMHPGMCWNEIVGARDPQSRAVNETIARYMSQLGASKSIANGTRAIRRYRQQNGANSIECVADEKETKIVVRRVERMRWIQAAKTRSMPRPALLERVKRVCQLRHPGAGIERIRSEALVGDYLCVRIDEGGGFEDLRFFAIVDTQLSAEIVTDFLNSVVAKANDEDAGVTWTLLCTEEQIPSQFRAQCNAVRVRLIKLSEYETLFKPSSYLEKQNNTLSKTATPYETKHYVPQRLTSLLDANAAMVPDALPHLLTVLQSEEPRFVFILGDFGVGKTFLLRELARHPLLGLMPVFISLRNAEKATSLDNILAQHLSNLGVADITPAKLRHAIETGRALLLLDGFDELAFRMGYDKASEHLDMLFRAYTENVDISRTKIVVTSRLQHWDSAATVQSTLSQRMKNAPGLVAVRIEPFCEEQIEQFLRARFSKDEGVAESRLAMLSSVGALRALATNPRMLSFMMELNLSKMGKTPNNALHAAVHVYRQLIDKWLDYEAKRASTPGTTVLSLETRWKAIRFFAAYLWQHRKTRPNGVTLRELPPETRQALVQLNPLPMPEDAVEHQIASGTLLTWDREKDGQLHFVHESVLEWLIAEQAANELRNDKPLATLAQDEISGSFANFFIAMVEPDAESGSTRPALRWAVSQLRPDVDATLRKNALMVLAQAHRGGQGDGVGRVLDLHGLDLQAADLSHADLRGANFSTANLSSANLHGADLRGASFESALLRGTDLSSANLEDAKLNHAQAVHAMLMGTRLHGAHLEGTNLRYARLVGSTGAELGEADTFGAAMPEATRVELGWARGHDAYTALAVSPDGLLVVTGHRDGALLLWDVLSRQVIRYLARQHSLVKSIAFHPNGQTIAVGARAGAVRILDVQTDDTLRAHLFLGDQAEKNASGFEDRHAIHALSFSADGEVLVLGHDDGRVYVWRWRDETLDVLGAVGASAYDVAFDPRNPQCLAVAYGGGSLLLWDLATQEAHALVGHRADVKCLAFHPEKNLLASGSEDWTVRLWNLDQRGEPGRVLVDGTLDPAPVDASVANQPASHAGPLSDLVFIDNGAWLLSTAENDLHARLWPLADRHAAKDTHAPDDRPIVLAQQRSGLKRLAAMPAQIGYVSLQDDDEALQAHQLHFQEDASPYPSHKPFPAYKPGTNVIAGMAPDGNLLALMGWDGAVRLWDMSTCRPIANLPSVDAVSQIEIDPTGAFVTLCGKQGITIVSLESFKQTSSLRVGKPRTLRAMALHPEKPIVAALGDDGYLFQWALSKPETPLQSKSACTGPAHSLFFSPKGDALFVVCANGSVCVYDENLVETTSFQVPAPDTKATAIAQKAALLMTGSSDGSLFLTSLEDRTPRPFADTTASVHCVAISAAGRWLASAGRADFAIELWDANAALPRKALRLDGHTRRITSLAFHASERVLVSASEDGTVRLWDTTDGKFLALLLPLRNGEWIALRADGRYNASRKERDEAWHVVGLCRFAIGDLAEIAGRRLHDDAEPFLPCLVEGLVYN